MRVSAAGAIRASAAWNAHVRGVRASSCGRAFLGAWMWAALTACISAGEDALPSFCRRASVLDCTAAASNPSVELPPRTPPALPDTRAPDDTGRALARVGKRARDALSALRLR